MTEAHLDLRRLCLLVALAFALCASAAAQEERRSQPQTSEAEERLSLAASSVDYPVTPGDLYRLSYYQSANTLVTMDLSVDATSAIDLGLFGKLDGRGMRFIELKQRIESLVANSYSHSLPSLRIVSPGIFRVSVGGEIEQVTYVTAWGLTRLSEIVESTHSRFASLRTIDVVARDGRSVRYDLLKAMRLGAADQDPYLRPGDRILLHPASRTVDLRGEVRRPGHYELTNEEGLRDLVVLLGGGLTVSADPSAIRLERPMQYGGEVVYLSLPEAYSSSTRLDDGDVVVIPSREAYASVVWIDGAVSSERLRAPDHAAATSRRETAPSPAAEGGPTPRAASTRFSLPIKRGQMLSETLVEAREAILGNADLSGARVYRRGVPLSFDAAPLLRAGPHDFDLALEPDDVIYIPDRASEVSVAGAVVSPGFFPYRPGAPATHYLGLAGGVDPERNSDGSYWVEDPMGRHRKTSESVTAGDRVYVPLNAPSFRLERSIPLVVAIITAALNAATLFILVTR